ncbi:hypothetical protein L596_027421 [Steinernema carpocapsae]|uniref:Uncharacterized protein n=1 Tax=Steinernema carpocapsae TaxID=34508 RepID=A0A4U5M4A3_STECR|nr:hypothetical protein L596_027421 [Steinernema carpocapsae]
MHKNDELCDSDRRSCNSLSHISPVMRFSPLFLLILIPKSSAIKCLKGEYGHFSPIDCPNQYFCVHADDNGYTFADCGDSTNPGIRTVLKLVDKGLNSGECTVGEACICGCNGSIFAEKDHQDR